MGAASPGRGSPFLFGQDFRDPPKPEGRPAVDPAALARAADEAYARGLAEGRRLAEADRTHRIADAAERLAASAAAAFASLDREAGRIEADAVLFFRTLAEAWVGQALAGDPLLAVSAAAAEAFRHLRGVPHVVVRVPPDLVDDTERLLKGRAREAGFEGRLIVLPDEALGPGDVAVEWADGGVRRDRAALERAVEAVLAEATAHKLNGIERP